MDQWETKTVALFFVGSVSLIKFVKDARLHFRGHADAGILKKDDQPGILDVGCDVDLSALRGEFDCIFQKIVPDMGSQLQVAVPDNRFQLRIEVQVSGGPGWLQSQDTPADLLIHPERLYFPDDRLIFQPGKA